MATLNLGELISPWFALANSTRFTHITLDSRQVQVGSLFVAVKGHALDGRQFIERAIQSGANGVVADSDDKHPHGEVVMCDQVPVLYLDDLATKLSQLAGRFYGAEQREMKLFGITGTNGKTTISQIIAQWADLLGTTSAVMGTTGNGLLHDLKPALNTTGSAIEIQQILCELEQQDAQLAALEISSHGLVQGRISALSFAVGIFTNLSRDHLDYHGDMVNYALAKKRLFTHHDCQSAVINADDEVGRQWLSEMPESIAVAVNKHNVANHLGQKLWAESVQYSEQGIELVIDSSWGKARFVTPLIGAFNASNVLLAMAALLADGYSLDELVRTAPKLQAVIGRMELFQTTNPHNPQAKVVVDYAHTPDALEKALSALQVHCQGKLWCIFGCGGDRDAGKRPMMAEIAERLSDEVIFTDDNPRTEDPAQIVEDMFSGVRNKDAVRVEHNRFKACQLALSEAQPNDIILLAGKGHEDYQVLATETIHYSDRESALQLLEALS